MNTIDTTRTQRVQAELETTRTPLSGVSIGDIIEGTLTSTDGKKSVITMDNGKSFQIDAKSIAAEIGQRISFSVADVNANSVVMKQIEENNAQEAEEEHEAESGEKLLSWAKGAVLPITGAAFASSKIMAENAAEQDVKMRDALNKIKKDLTLCVNGANKSAAALLTENGVSLDNATVSMLSAAVKSAVRGVSAEPTAEEVADALAEYANSDNKNEHQNIVNSARALLTEGVPATEANISQLTGVLEKLGETEKLGTDTKINLLRKGRELTLENVFAALHAGGANGASGTNGENGVTDSDWKDILPGVKKYFSAKGIEPSTENLGAARVLIANDIPVEKESIDFLNGRLERRSVEDILQNAAQNILKGKSPLNVAVYGREAVAEIASRRPAELFENYKEIIRRLPEITDNTLGAAVQSGEPVTIAGLISAQKSMAGGGEQRGENEQNRGERFVSEKIKLEEIRLRLTLSAASQMARAGISIDTMGLQGALNELKALESKNNAAALEVAGVAPTEHAVREMSERSEKIRGLSGTHDSVKRSVMLREIEFTAEKLHEANENARERAAKQSYEAAETAPNAKFGDSVSKVLGQVETLLETLGIEAFPENAKAARSLVRTGQDVTKENIEAVKAVNNKIDYVTNNFRPLISAQMLKEGFNPLSAHIDEVIAYIDKYNEVYGEPPVESVEKAIFSMDERGELSKEERKSLIGMYRMMSTINGNEAAASAVIAKSGKSLTLENLMEAGKYHQKTKSRQTAVDRRLGGSDGGSEAVYNENSIKEQLQAAYRQTVAELPAVGLTGEAAEAAANENNYGLTAPNVELFSEIAASDTELNGYNINTAANIKHSIERLPRTLRDANALEYMKARPELEKTDIRELLSEMDEFLSRNAESESARNTSEAASFSVFKEDMKSLAGVPPQQLAWMLEMNLPLSIGNIKTVYGMSKERNYLGKRLEELQRLAESIAENGITEELPDTSLESLINGETPGELLERITEKAGKLTEDAALADLPQRVVLREKAALIENAAKLLRETGKSGRFQIPVKLHDGVAGLNIYVLNQDADTQNMNAFLRLDMNGIGTVQANINISDGFADITVEGESGGVSEFLSNNAKLLEASLNELNLKGYKISFATHENKETTESDGNGEHTRQPQAKDGAGAVDVRL